MNGDTPLHLAAARVFDELIGTLLRRGADVDVANNGGQRALRVAVIFNYITSAEALLEAGADPNLGYGNHYEDIPLALAGCDVAMTAMLLKYGADIKASDCVDYTALHRVAESGMPDVIDALVEAWADLGARSDIIWTDTGYEYRGLTPLHAAAIRVDVENIARLLDNRADINATDDDGYNAQWLMWEPTSCCGEVRTRRSRTMIGIPLQS
ncbi:unnamed protein product [Pylaiella littoralis]